MFSFESGMAEKQRSLLVLPFCLLKVFRRSFFRNLFVIGRQSPSVFAWFAEKRTLIHLRILQLENIYIIFYWCNCLLELSTLRKGHVVLNVLKNSHWRLQCGGMVSYLWVFFTFISIYLLTFTFSPPKGLSSLLFSVSFCLWAEASFSLCPVCWKEDILLRKMQLEKVYVVYHLCSCLVELSSRIKGLRGLACV